MLLKWVCMLCDYRHRQIADVRPEEGPFCPNDQHQMVNDVGGSTSVMETLDNGAMPRKVERFRDIGSMRHSHGELTNPKDPTIV